MAAASIKSRKATEALQTGAKRALRARPRLFGTGPFFSGAEYARNLYKANKKVVPSPEKSL
jgi:hypothetical protein